MARDLSVRSPDDLERMIPKHMRILIDRNDALPHYRVNAPDYDRLPLETFLVETTMGTMGRHMSSCCRIVKPNEPKRYLPSQLTAGKRLLYVYWDRGHAVRGLKPPASDVYHHIVLPGDPRFPMMEAFKIGCDHARAAARKPEFPPTLLHRALGVEPLSVEMGRMFGD
jgi:hypothetical protein